MDPNACLRKFEVAVLAYELTPLGVDTSEVEKEMKEAHENLCEWLRNGGFEPDWRTHGHFINSKEKFLNYYNKPESDGT
jgi:hypothetical protein